MIGNSRDFLESITGYVNAPVQGPTASDERPARLGVIDQYYTAGPARVLFDGETVLSKKGYAWVNSYVPEGGDRVFLFPVGQTYIIGGVVKADVPYPRWLTNGLRNNWVDYDPANYHPESMTKSASGVVKFAGLIKNGITTKNTGLTSIPEDFRPPVSMIFPVSTNGKAGSVLVNSRGTVAVVGFIDASWVSLANITYQTEVMTWNAVGLTNGFVAEDTEYNVGAPQWAKDSYGRIWLRGGITRSTVPTGDLTMFNLPAEARPSNKEYLTTVTLAGATSGHGYIDIGVDGDVKWKTGSQSATMVLSGAHYTVPEVPWTTPTMQSGWLDYSSVYNSAGYRKDADNTVHLKGLIKSGTVGAAAFTLPVGFRPSRTLVNSTVSSQLYGRVDIRSTGVVIPLTGTNEWLSLDGISFVAEQ